MSNRALFCSRCGQQRSFNELNGLTLIDGQWHDDSAYCQRVADCDSSESGEILGWIAEQLEVEPLDNGVNVVDQVHEWRSNTHCLDSRDLCHQAKSRFGFEAIEFIDMYPIGALRYQVAASIWDQLSVNPLYAASFVRQVSANPEFFLSLPDHLQIETAARLQQAQLRLVQRGDQSTYLSSLQVLPDYILDLLPAENIAAPLKSSMPRNSLALPAMLVQSLITASSCLSQFIEPDNHNKGLASRPLSEGAQ